MVKIRKQFFPRRLLDYFYFLTIFTFLPIVFVFELIVVLPAFYKSDTLACKCHLGTCFFLFFNVIGNFLYCILVDTAYYPEQQQNEQTTADWNYCNTCSQMIPPRTWHCYICDVCILKRDHHCLITGCCIGHRNQRYFLLFVIYLFVGSVYAGVYNSIYIWVLEAETYFNWMTLTKMFFPLVMLFHGNITTNMIFLFYCLNLIVLFSSSILLIFQIQVMFRGAVCFELKEQIFDYDLGWKQNILLIFGENWYWVWLSPLISSKQNHDGLKWEKSSKCDVVNVQNNNDAVVNVQNNNDVLNVQNNVDVVNVENNDVADVNGCGNSGGDTFSQ